MDLYTFLLTKKIAEREGVESADASRMALANTMSGLPPVANVLMTQQSAQQRVATSAESLEETLKETFVTTEAVTVEALENKLGNTFAKADEVTAEALENKLQGTFVETSAIDFDGFVTELEAFNAVSNETVTRLRNKEETSTLLGAIALVLADISNKLGETPV